MYILYGILTLILGIAAPMGIYYFTGFQIYNFSLFFIIPVGAIVIGYISGYGYFNGLKKSNKKVVKKDYIIAIVIALICVVGIHYSTYAITHIDEEGQLVKAFSGDHISNYELDGYGRLTFANFTKFRIESTPISFSYKARKLGSVNNPTACWIFAGIDMLGVLFGCLAVGLNVAGESYCDKCQKYKVSKSIFKIPRQNGEEFFNELNTVVTDIQFNVSLKQLVDKYTSAESNDYYSCELVYCDECKETELVFSLYERNKKNKEVKNDDFNHVVRVNNHIVKEYL